MGENIVCAVIDVDCYQNNPDDIKYGGPKFIGFEFYVRKKNKQVMTDYVRCMLYEYGVPVINIRNNISKIVNEDEIHTPEKVREVISKYRTRTLLEEGYRKYYCRKLSL